MGIAHQGKAPENGNFAHFALIGGDPSLLNLQRKPPLFSIRLLFFDNVVAHFCGRPELRGLLGCWWGCWYWWWWGVGGGGERWWLGSEVQQPEALSREASQG